MKLFTALTLFATAGLAFASDQVPGSPYPASPVIADITFDWSTHHREAQGSDNWQLTWADDNNLYGAWGDGGGFNGSNANGRTRLGYARIEGDWNNFKGTNVWGGLNGEHPATFNGKSWGTTCVAGVLYSWIIPDEPDNATTPTPPEEPQGEREPTGNGRDHYRYVQLARSTDHGATWEKAAWRWWREDNLTAPTFVIFGRNNAGARDEYVYAYFIKPRNLQMTQARYNLSIHQPGALFLARVPQGKIFESREAYEWFKGLDTKGQPQWGALADKQTVFDDPNGTGWCMSASYNPGLHRYLLATEHGVTSSSLMAIFDAPEPWGPWTTVKYWQPEDRFAQQRPGSAHEWRDNIFFFSFVPKWRSADGQEFILSFTGLGGGKDNDSFNTVRGKFLLRSSATPARTP